MLLLKTATFSSVMLCLFWLVEMVMIHFASELDDYLMDISMLEELRFLGSILGQTVKMELRLRTHITNLV